MKVINLQKHNKQFVLYGYFFLLVLFALLQNHCLVMAEPSATQDEKNIQVNTTVSVNPQQQYPETQLNLKQRMDLAGQNLVNMCCPEWNYLPLFWVAVNKCGQPRHWRWESYWSFDTLEPLQDGPELQIEAETHLFSLEHNIGRWIDAMLRLENATGFTAPAEIDRAMVQNLRRFFDNADNLCLTPLDMPHSDADLFYVHSFREHLLALNALAKYRNDPWAIQKGHKMLETLEKLLLPEDQWLAKGTVWDITRTQRYKEAGQTEIQPYWCLALQATEGRLIEALIWFYETTGDSLALKLADKFARFHLNYSTLPDGSFPGGNLAGHAHSYLGTLRGLLLYGELTGQHEYIDRVAKTYKVTVPRMIKKSGFISHDMGKEEEGEVGSAGDIAQLALWLATRHGYTELFDDVERIVRARIIPSQITEKPDFRAGPRMSQDRQILGLDKRLILHPYIPEERLEEIVVGAIGGMYRWPHGGKNSVVDVTAAALHSLVDIYQNIYALDDTTLKVNLHFDCRDKNVAITSTRGKRAAVVILPKVEKNVFIRIPGWTDPQSVNVKVNGQQAIPQWVGSYVLIPKDLKPKEIVITYDLPVQTEIEPVNGVDYTLTWRGDEIVGICPNSDFYPFYPTGDGCK